MAIECSIMRGALADAIDSRSLTGCEGNATENPQGVFDEPQLQMHGT
jgi:hypothetical protein